MVNWLAVVDAAIVAMIVGFIWYSPPLFGNGWMDEVMKGTKRSAKDMKKGMMKGMAMAFVAALISSWILATLVKSTQSTTFMSALKLGAGVWAGFYVSLEIVRFSFGGQSMKLFWINVFHHLVAVSAMATVLVLLP